eukprot:9473392-Pyramimonas_sp.AAC.1
MLTVAYKPRVSSAETPVFTEHKKLEGHPRFDIAHMASDDHAQITGQQASTAEEVVLQQPHHTI